MGMRYHKDMTVNEVVFSNTKAIEIFHKYRLKCLTCLGAEKETLEDMARANNISLDQIISDLNNMENKNACG